MLQYIFTCLLGFVGVTQCLSVSRTNENLTAIPLDIHPNVTRLDVSHNQIERIGADTLRRYALLVFLGFNVNNLKYIEYGSFDHNPFLEQIVLTNNMIESMPAPFCEAPSKLLKIGFWSAITVVQNISFRSCDQLLEINLGYNAFGLLDASILPSSLLHLLMNSANLREFPALPLHTPHLEMLSLKSNAITYIPTERILGLPHLMVLDLTKNGLLTIPDLWSIPLSTILLDGNPLVCNASLCHLCMRPTLDIDVTCGSPVGWAGQQLMSINPLHLGCEQGE